MLRHENETARLSSMERPITGVRKLRTYFQGVLLETIKPFTLACNRAIWSRTGSSLGTVSKKSSCSRGSFAIAISWTVTGPVTLDSNRSSSSKIQPSVSMIPRHAGPLCQDGIAIIRSEARVLLKILQSFPNSSRKGPPHSLRKEYCQGENLENDEDPEQRHC